MQKGFIGLSLFLLVAVGGARGKRVRRIVGGNPADVAAADDPVVFLDYAGKSARVHGIYEGFYYHFRGIRYAHNPTGKDRFQRPRKYFLEGNIDATVYGSPCIQSVPGEDLVFGSEDCLLLNVFTPNLPDGTEGLPVIIWIHGGGFRYGSASQYGAKHLMNKHLVVVTIQYRLGTLGFLSSGTSTFPGNAALFDMVLAIEWVKNHIGFFGGNPLKINVMGHGTGGSSALLLVLSEMAKAQVAGVIAMSGTAISHWAIDDAPTKTATEIADYQGCPTQSVVTMIKCLQNIPAESLVRGDSYMESTRLKSRGFISGLSGLLSSSPVTEGLNDGRSLPAAVQRKPLDDMYFKRTPRIPLLTGVTRDETKKAIEGQYKEEIVAKLGTVPHFLDQVLIKNLQSLTGLGVAANSSEASSFWQILDPLKFRSYASVATNSVEAGLAKVAEIAGDSLFNLPAYLTADLWSKSAPTYLYQFEHYGRARKGDQFLRGIPIIGNQTYAALNDSVCHGDDLAYLFEARNLDGSPLKDPEEYTPEDEEVREIFTRLIADFAKNGRVTLQNVDVGSFSGVENNFIRITTRPTVGVNFRFCQLALWAGFADRLGNVACKFLDVPANIADTIIGAAGKEFVKSPALPLPEIGFPNPLAISKTNQQTKNAPFSVFG